MEATIRPITYNELLDTVHIYLACIREDYGYKPHAYLNSLNVEVELAECKDWIDAEGNRNKIFAAFIGTLMIGYIAVGPSTDELQVNEGEVTGFFIRSAYRNRGIGLRLLRTGLEYLRESGYKRVILYNYRNGKANNFYRRLGGEVLYSVTQFPGGMDLNTDVFIWETDAFLIILNERVKKYEFQ